MWVGRLTPIDQLDEVNLVWWITAMPRTGELPPTQVETPVGLRGMADRARRLADQLPPYDRGRQTLLEFAAELDTRAKSLESVETNAPKT